MNDYPIDCKLPEDEDLVQMIVQERVARVIEQRILMPYGLSLAGPLKFSEDGLPSYTLQIDRSVPLQN